MRPQRENRDGSNVEYMKGKIRGHVLLMGNNKHHTHLLQPCAQRSRDGR